MKGYAWDLIENYWAARVLDFNNLGVVSCCTCIKATAVRHKVRHCSDGVQPDIKVEMLVLFYPPSPLLLSHADDSAINHMDK